MQAIFQDMEYVASVSVLLYTSVWSAYFWQNKLHPKTAPVESCEDKQNTTKPILAFSSLKVKFSIKRDRTKSWALKHNNHKNILITEFLIYL